MGLLSWCATSRQNRVFQLKAPFRERQSTTPFASDPKEDFRLRRLICSWKPAGRLFRLAPGGCAAKQQQLPPWRGFPHILKKNSKRFPCRIINYSAESEGCSQALLTVCSATTRRTRKRSSMKSCARQRKNS